MSCSVAGKAFVVWVGILGLAILNGGLRDLVLIPALGSMAGYILSGVLLSALILFVAWLALPWLGPRRPAALPGVGLLWLCLTLVFEFSFGLWQGKSLHVLLQAYTFRGGNIWPVVLVVTLLAPWIAGKLRRWR